MVTMKLTCFLSKGIIIIIIIEEVLALAIYFIWPLEYLIKKLLDSTKRVINHFYPQFTDWLESVPSLCLCINSSWWVRVTITPFFVFFEFPLTKLLLNCEYIVF